MYTYRGKMHKINQINFAKFKIWSLLKLAKYYNNKIFREMRTPLAKWPFINFIHYINTFYIW